MAASQADQSGDETALVATLYQCESADDWLAGLEANPTAGNRTSYTRDTAIAFLDVMCVTSIAATVCHDALAKDLLSYGADDPRLPALQEPAP